MYFVFVTLIVNFCNYFCSDVDTYLCIIKSIAVLFSDEDFGILQCIITHCVHYYLLPKMRLAYLMSF